MIFLKNLWWVLALCSISCNLTLDPEDKPLKEDKVIKAENLVRKLKSFSGSRGEIIEYMSYRLVEAKRILELPLNPLELLKLNNKKPNIDGCQIVKAYAPSDRGNFFSIGSVNCRPRVCLNTKKTQNCHLFLKHLSKVVNSMERYESLGSGDWPERLIYEVGQYNVAVKIRNQKSNAKFTESRHLDARFIGLDEQGRAQYDVYYEVSMDDIEQEVWHPEVKVNIFSGRQHIYISAIFVVNPVSLKVVQVNNASVELRNRELPRRIKSTVKKRAKSITQYNEMRVTMHSRFIEEVCHINEEGVEKCRRQKKDHPIIMDNCGMGLNQWQVKFKGKVGKAEKQGGRNKYKSYGVPVSLTEVAEQEGRCGPKSKPARNIIHYGLFFLK